VDVDRACREILDGGKRGNGEWEIRRIKEEERMNVRERKAMVAGSDC
jgi:hypothetical protein